MALNVAQVWPAATLNGAVTPLNEKPDPVTEMFEMFNATLPVLVTVIACELVTPVTTLPKLMLVGETETADCPELEPVPVNAIVETAGFVFAVMEMLLVRRASCRRCELGAERRALAGPDRYRQCKSANRKTCAGSRKLCDRQRGASRVCHGKGLGRGGPRRNASEGAGCTSYRHGRSRLWGCRRRIGIRARQSGAPNLSH